MVEQTLSGVLTKEGAMSRLAETMTIDLPSADENSSIDEFRAAVSDPPATQ
jgi:hypothetical protein